MAVVAVLAAEGLQVAGNRSIRRFLRHVCSGPWLVRRHFPASAMRNIEAAVARSEAGHSGEIRFVVEAALHPFDLLRGVTPRQRAIELFARLGIWDTQHNNGVLIYLLLADHDVEIVADRGVDHEVGTQGWQAICLEMEAAFRQGCFENGVITGIARISDLLRQQFPTDVANDNELPDAPLVL
ncbi:MAG TPA: TPM domain-containing protein [Methylophilaceae bacterium]|nr:TPM domain-containing protein [Methylophilaceae bacterium]